MARAGRRGTGAGAWGWVRGGTNGLGCVQGGAGGRASHAGGRPRGYYGIHEAFRTNLSRGAARDSVLCESERRSQKRAETRRAVPCADRAGAGRRRDTANCTLGCARQLVWRAELGAGVWCFAVQSFVHCATRRVTVVFAGSPVRAAAAPWHRSNTVSYANTLTRSRSSAPKWAAEEQTRQARQGSRLLRAPAYVTCRSLRGWLGRACSWSLSETRHGPARVAWSSAVPHSSSRGPRRSLLRLHRRVCDAGVGRLYAQLVPYGLRATLATGSSRIPDAPDSRHTVDCETAFKSSPQHTAAEALRAEALNVCDRTLTYCASQ